MTPSHLTQHEIRTIAAAAYCDPRSVVKAFSGQPLAPLTRERVIRALRELNRTDLLARIDAETASPRVA